MPAPQFTLGRNERIKSRKKLEELFQRGQQLQVGSYRIYWLSSPETGLQVGVSAGKRHFKRAVDRNRIKRLIREAWRLQKNHLRTWLQNNEKGLVVFIIYTGKEIPLYEKVYPKIGKVIEKLQAKLLEKSGTLS